MEGREAGEGTERGALVSGLRRLAHAVDSLPTVWALATLAVIFMVAGLMPVRPNDFWWHVRAGQWIVEHGRVPSSDFFSFTRFGEPWAHQSWLMEVALYGLLRAGGLPLVIFAHAVVITSAHALLLRTSARASSGSLRIAAGATVAAAAATLGWWNVRPQIISFPLFCLALLLIDRDARQTEGKRDRRWRAGALWWLPAVFVLWANAHGGFVFGLGLLGTYLCARLIEWGRGRSAFPAALLVIAALSGGATLLTPLGVGMVDYVLGFVRHPATARISSEFGAPSARNAPGQILFVFAIMWMSVLIMSGYRPSVRESLRLLVFGVLALWAIRNVIWFVFVATPTMAASRRASTAAKSRPGGRSTNRPWINRALAIVIVILAFLSLPWLGPYARVGGAPRVYLSSDTPVGAAEFVCSLPDVGRIFNSKVTGSYLVWACPEVPVFVDTRIELYPEEQWNDYLALSAARYDWQAILDRYEIDTLVLDRVGQENLIEAASAADEWERVYEDEQAVILQRAEGR